jgi:hypothetical protein
VRPDRDAATARGSEKGESPPRGATIWITSCRNLQSLPGLSCRDAYENVAAFAAKVRKREATSALALELCILTAARSDEILGMRWPEIDLDKKI